AHGYRRGFSASPGFRQIRHTSPSSSSSSNLAGGAFTGAEEAGSDFDTTGGASSAVEEDAAAAGAGIGEIYGLRGRRLKNGESRASGGFSIIPLASGPRYRSAFIRCNGGSVKMACGG
ncbi:hypothetical protein CRG98_046087, partial [Punica granatum]